MPGAGTPGSSVAVGAALPLEAAAAPAAGLGALRPLLGLQSFAPARGRAASLEAARYRRASQAAINGGVWADRREPPLGPPRGLIDTSGALIHVSRDGFGHRDGVALVAPSASYWPSETRSRHACDYIKLPRRRQKVHDSVAGSLLRAAVAPH
jgi:hypothetical protein